VRSRVFGGLQLAIDGKLRSCDVPVRAEKVVPNGYALDRATASHFRMECRVSLFLKML
jgi:hypothetical protein